MRERTLKSLFDKIMWYGIYLFPLIAYVCFILSCRGIESTSYVDLSFMEFMIGLGFADGPVYNVFTDLFSDGGISTFFNEYGFAAYANYLVFVTILHVVFDVIVFIPRLFHNFLDTFEKGDIIK